MPPRKTMLLRLLEKRVTYLARFDAAAERKYPFTDDDYEEAGRAFREAALIRQELLAEIGEKVLRTKAAIPAKQADGYFQLIAAETSEWLEARRIRSSIHGKTERNSTI